jgi:BirA family biotin operon repressor/biotin-[acetyl-CoA-carboxylase] ligase
MSPVLGTPRIHLRRVASTNDRARELAREGAPHGTLVTAAEQTAGRGRHGRSWWAPPGGALLLSLVLRESAPLVSLATAVAVCDVVGEAARIKWPNDVVLPPPRGAIRVPEGADEGVDGGGARARTASAGTGPLPKLAGILAEGLPQHGATVLGIGLNVAVDPASAPPELRPQIASLERAPDAVEPLLEELLGMLARRLDEAPAAMLAAWRARDALAGRPIAWSLSGDPAAPTEHGRAEGIDEAGRLIVTGAQGATIVLDGGEVHLAPVL